MNRAIVTGGASGLGFEVAKLLLGQNFEVIIIGRNKEKLNRAVSSLQSISPQVSSYALDISDEEAVTTFMKHCKPSNYLFNIAGNGVFGSIESIDKKSIDDVLQANLIGLILMSTGFIKTFQQNLTLINVMSTAAKKGKKGEAIYCAAKFGAKGFTEALQATYKGTDIHVIGIYPGGMATEFWQVDPRDTSTFMNPADVAQQIINTLNPNTYVTELVIERP